MTPAARRLFLTLLLLNFLWAPVNLAVRSATNDGTSPAAIALLRWPATGLLLLGLLQFPAFRELTRAKWPVPSDGLKAALVGMFFFAPAHVIYYGALRYTTTTEANTLGSTAPLWIAIGAFFFLRERVRPERWLAIAIGFVGAYVVSVGFQVPTLSRESASGNLAYLGGVIIETFAMILAIRLILRSSGIAVLTLQILGGSVALLLGAWLVPSLMPVHLGSGPATLWALAYLILVPGLVCFTAWYMLVEKTPVSYMVVTQAVQPPLAALLGWWLLQESLTLSTLVGSALVLASLLVTAFVDRPRRET